MFKGELLAIIATSALELGIDIGSLGQYVLYTIMLSQMRLRVVSCSCCRCCYCYGIPVVDICLGMTSRILRIYLVYSHLLNTTTINSASNLVELAEETKIRCLY
jgi:ATP-dependent helicase YprA (DUF1998 family)